MQGSSLRLKFEYTCGFTCIPRSERSNLTPDTGPGYQCTLRIRRYTMCNTDTVEFQVYAGTHCAIKTQLSFRERVYIQYMPRRTSQQRYDLQVQKESRHLVYSHFSCRYLLCNMQERICLRKWAASGSSHQSLLFLIITCLLFPIIPFMSCAYQVFCLFQYSWFNHSIYLLQSFQ